MYAYRLPDKLWLYKVLCSSFESIDCGNDRLKDGCSSNAVQRRLQNFKLPQLSGLRVHGFTQVARWGLQHAKPN
jgi:hypothetical protein